MPTTMQALAVTLLAILPGAACAFAFESRAGSYGVKLPDRIIRFLAISAGLHALASGFTYYLYRTQFVTGRFEHGREAPYAIEFAALVYFVGPLLIGWLAGTAKSKQLRVARIIAPGTLEPRAWDHLASRKPLGVWRLRLKSGRWIAGYFAKASDGSRSYISGYPEDGDLYLSVTVLIDQETGEFQRDKDGGPLLHEQAGIYVKLSEVEYAQIIRGE